MTFLPVLFLVAENQDAGILSDFLKTKLASYLSFNFRGMNRNNDQSTFSISSQRSRPFRSPHVSCNFLLDNALEFLKEPITTTQFVLPRRFQHLSPDENWGIRKSSCKSLYIYKYMTLTPCLLHLQFTYIWPFPKTPCPAKRVASGGMIRGMFRRYVSGVCFGVCFALPC